MLAHVFLGFALFASAISVNKVILQTLPPILFIGIRMFVAGCLLVLFTHRKSKRYNWNYIKHDAGILLVISLFTTLIPALLKAFALQNLISSKAAFLGSLDPFVTVLYAYLLWNEKISLQKFIGIMFGFAGTLVMLVSSSPIEEHIMAWRFVSYPELAALGSLLLSRFGWLMVQKLLRKGRYEPMELNGINMLCSGLLALVMSYACNFASSAGEGSYLRSYSLSHIFSTITITPQLIGLMLYTIIIGNLIAYTMYAHFLKKYSATFVSLAGFSIPLWVYLFGRIFLQEPPSLYSFIAAGITFIGLLIFYQQEITDLFKKHSVERNDQL